MDFKLNKSNLNFRVYNAIETPASGNENDVVIISNTPITNWIMSPNAPSGEPRNEGDVHIRYKVSNGTTNLLKSNSFMVCLTSAHQHIDGVWMTVDAYIYQDNEWVSLSGGLPDVWFHYDGHGWNSKFASYESWGNSVMMSNDYIDITMSEVDAKYGLYSSAIDFTPYKTLQLDVRFSGITKMGSSNQGFRFGVGDSDREWTSTHWSAEKLVAEPSSEWKTYSLDISSVNKSNYLRLHTWIEGQGHTYVRNVILEK